MTQTERILDTLKGCSNVTPTTISLATGIPRSNVASLLSVCVTKTTPGLTRRHLGARRGYAYSYYPDASVAPSAPAPEPEAVPKPKASLNELSESSSTMGLDDLVQQLADAFAAKVSAAFVSTMQARLQTDMQKLIAAAPRSTTPREAEVIVAHHQGTIHRPEKPAPKVQLPTVLIIGLLPHQAGTIQQEYHEVLDLEFLIADDSTHRIAESSKHADHTLVMVDFVNHKVTNALSRYKIIKGGMTRLRDALTEIYVNASDKEKAA